MLLANRLKFEQHEDLAQSLVTSGDDRILVDFNDNLFFGVKMTKQDDGSTKIEGENMLGKILMQIRDEMRGKVKSDGPIYIEYLFF